MLNWGQAGGRLATVLSSSGTFDGLDVKDVSEGRIVVAMSS